MPIAEITGPTPIGAGILNVLIRAVNKLESANRFNGTYFNGTQYDSTNDNIYVLGQRQIITGIPTDLYYSSGPQYVVRFKKTFASTPVVTVTPDSTAGAYITPFIRGVYTDRVELGFIRVYAPYTTTSDQRLPATLGINVIAVGPVVATT